MVNNIRIGLATDSMTFTPTEAFSYSNGYDYFFENGQEFTDIIEEDSPSIATGFTYGSNPRTNTFKAKVSGSMVQIKTLEKYSHIVVYKNNSLVFCGFNPTFSKTIKKGVGAHGNKQSYVEATISYSDYTSSLKDVTFSSDESFDLYYTKDDNVYVCNPSNTSKSLVHILMGYLDPSHKFTVHFGTMPSVLTTTKVSYFAVTYEDKVLSILKDVLEQAGLAMYCIKMHLYIIDVLETLSGTAVNIPNIEADATKKGRAFVEETIPSILMATARIAENVTVYDSGNMTIEGKDWAWSDTVFYPADDMYAEGSFTCERQDGDHPNGKADNEKEKRYFNFRERDWYGEVGIWGYGAKLSSFSRTATGIKYRVLNDGILRRKFRISQKADVLLFKYSSAFKPTDNWNKEEVECDYIFSEAMAQRYANALLYQKKSQATYYDFYADVSEAYPDGYPINSVITLQGTDETNPLLLIVSKTDNMDAFGGYSYRAIPYDRSGVSLSNTYVASHETLQPNPYGFVCALTRDVIECFESRTPKDATPVRFTLTTKNRLAVPILTVAGQTVSMARLKEEVVVEGGVEYADTDSWYYDIDANLNGYDTCIVNVVLDGISDTYTISKLVKTASREPEIIVPASYVKVTQYCYGDSDSPEPRHVADASYDLEDALDIVADIWWQDEVDGECPLRPRMGYYIWRREGVYDPETETQPSSWTESLFDTPYYRFDFKVSQFTYVKNDRSTQTNENVIYFTPDLVGLNATALVLTASNGLGTLPFDSENQRFTLTFNAKNAPSGKIKVEAVLGALKWSCFLTCDDQTERNLYNGILASAPSAPLVGDSYVDSTADYVVKVYTENGWKLLSQSGLPLALLSEICGKAQKDVLTNIPAGSVAQSDYGYFNVIIAGMITADYIKALKGVFEDIEVSGSISVDHEFVMKGVFMTDRYYPQNFF